ncbi:MAG: protein kinase, partial [Phycisphaerales bacterium]|nr:protein kinase [Phycisphaerales bacterium]
VDGRARIVDFGLSRAPDPTATDDEARRAGDSLTAVGTIIGTPAYMSPEQLLGRGLDARSDQYAFAVVLHEALTGKRPHAGKTVPDRLREGFEVVFPGDSPVPRRIQRVLTRALAELPERRFRTMDELLAALTRDPWRRWRRIATVAATAGAAGLAGYALTGG